ncbi:MAG: hypothetical protein ABR529_13945 [Actinomycetota bacterium]
MSVKTRPIRVPEDVHESVRAVSALSGRTPGDVLAAAYREYLQRHGSELAEVFTRAQGHLKAGDTEGLYSLLGESRRERAAAAATAAAEGSD